MKTFIHSMWREIIALLLVAAVLVFAIGLIGGVEKRMFIESCLKVGRSRDWCDYEWRRAKAGQSTVFIMRAKIE